MKSWLNNIRHVVLDMDGTIYRGGTLFPTTLPFLALLRGLEIGYTFVTNNSSRNAEDYQRKLKALGIEIEPEQLYTSAHATIEHLQEHRPDIQRLFILGTPSLLAEFADAGFEIASDLANDEPDAVVVGYDESLTFPRLCRAAWWIKQGKPFLATHPDRVCPTDEPTVLIDCGSVCACLEMATGRAPDVVLGKPDPAMIHGILHRHGLTAPQLVMVGDRLYTDIAMARRAGALAVLVLTGEATAAEAEAFMPAPDLIVEGLDVLGEKLQQARREMALT